MESPVKLREQKKVCPVVKTLGRDMVVWVQYQHLHSVEERIDILCRVRVKGSLGAKVQLEIVSLP